MLPSLRSKIIVLILFVLVVTGASITFFTKKDVGKAMLEAEVRSVANSLGLIHTTIKGEYEGLLDYKVSTVQARKSQLRHMASTGLSLCREYLDMVESGLLTREAARIRLVNLFSSIRSGAGEMLTIIDPEDRIIFHPDTSKTGRSMADLTDMKGRAITRIVREQDSMYGGNFAVFTWDDSPGERSGKQLGYFLPFGAWDWIVGAVISVDDISVQEHQKIRELVKGLETTLAKIRIAQTGGVTIFNTAKQPVTIHPEQSSLPDSIMTTLIENAGTDKGFVRYTEQKEGGSQEMLARAFFFKPLGWYVTAFVPAAEIQEPANNLVTRQTMVILVISLIGLILGLVFAGRISGPLKELTGFAKELPGMDLTTQSSAATTPIDHLTTRSRDEVSRLAAAFVFMLAELRKNVTHLMEVTASRERIQSELNVAKEIQEGILPKIFPAFPDRKEIQLFASLESAKQVGGDLYDFFFIDPNRLCFVIGDVSDKGVPAALFMAITMTLIRSTAEEHDDPAEIMTRVNDKLSRENPNSMFVTLFIGILDTSTGHVSYANGGHNPAILITNDGHPLFQEGLSGLVVGGMEGVPYTGLSFDMHPGETVFLYTDGVTEALDADKNLFSDQRLLDEVTVNRQADPETLIQAIRESVSNHVGTAPQSDDITMLALRYTG
jgi:sigma-B regulation protein RsbU (phosphoserine phosphatase)